MADRKINRLVSPVLKWVGGKRQLIKDIEKKLPSELLEGKLDYFEPFVGGGALLFHIQPNSAVINDSNGELINLYKVVKSNPEELIEDLKKHKNEKDYFYRIRELDRNPEVFSLLSDLEKASRIIYLNKTCYNGLFRVNSKGQFNTPFGRYKNPNFMDEERIRAVSSYLSSADIRILNTDFEVSLEGVTPESFVYFDPPYDPVSESAYFTSYGSTGFDRNEQLRLKKLCDRIDSMGVRFLLSNSATDFIRNLYSDYTIEVINANRAVNSKAEKRGAVREVLVRNY